MQRSPLTQNSSENLYSIKGTIWQALILQPQMLLNYNAIHKIAH